ncbi:GTP-binding protein REM 1 [Candoia aspera]|uniref:GTP-binding protein REM 1 n=1 Tax=Candoia aspera TaxID=51853 RepID=UPI002FD80D09
MTLNIQRGSSMSPCQRRASTPLPGSRSERPSPRTRQAEPCHPQLGHSSSCEPRACLPEPCGGWLSESSGSNESCGSLYRVVLLGDPGVGKTSLVNLFAGVQEKDYSLEQQREDTYERTLSVDGEETTLVVIDTWEAEKRSSEEDHWLHHDCMQVGNAYVIVYSITDRGSFESASELRIQLRRTRQAENIPIILVGNKSDLVRSREVSVEEGRACAVVFDCKFIETSAALQHNVTELFEGVVRQIRLRKDSKEANERRMSLYKRKESLTKKVRRFLDQLAARNNKKVALKVRSKSCHDLSVL